MSDIVFTPALELSEAVRKKRISSTEIANAFLHRIEEMNPEINAYVYCNADAVRMRAIELESSAMKGEFHGPLHGVPFSIKDLTAVKGVPLTFGMVPFKDNIAKEDAAIVRRMNAAGGLFMGMTNTPESGYKGVTDNHLFGPTQNPWKPGYIAGGSSGGAAAAVAAGLCPIAEGSDGGGSIRIPSSCCGVYGLKPSLGRIPQTVLPNRYLTFANHGPIARTVADAALMLSVTGGQDSSDPLSVPGPPQDYLAEIHKDIAGWRVAWSPDLGFGDVDREIREICREAVKAFEELGCTVEESHPGWDDPEEAMWQGLWVPTFAGEIDMLDWKAWDGLVDAQLLEMLEEGKRLSARDVARAELFRSAMWDRFSAWFRQYDLLVCPTACVEPFENGRFTPKKLDGQSLRKQLLGWCLTYPFNMLGTTPAASIPCGFTSNGLPVGLQIVGHPYADAAVLRASANFEQVRPWAARRPNLHGSVAG